MNDIEASTESQVAQKLEVALVAFREEVGQMVGKESGETLSQKEVKGWWKFS